MTTLSSPLGLDGQRVRRSFFKFHDIASCHLNHYHSIQPHLPPFSSSSISNMEKANSLFVQLAKKAPSRSKFASLFPSEETMNDRGSTKQAKRGEVRKEEGE